MSGAKGRRETPCWGGPLVAVGVSRVVWLWRGTATACLPGAATPPTPRLTTSSPPLRRVQSSVLCSPALVARVAHRLLRAAARRRGPIGAPSRPQAAPSGAGVKGGLGQPLPPHSSTLRGDLHQVASKRQARIPAGCFRRSWMESSSMVALGERGGDLHERGGRRGVQIIFQPHVC